MPESSSGIRPSFQLPETLEQGSGISIQSQSLASELERLRSRKAAVSSQIDERRAATRFEPVAEEQAGSQRDLGEVLADATAGGSSAPQRPAQTPTVAGTTAQDETTYTERLLAAKKKAN